MRSKEGLIMLRILFILVVLCNMAERSRVSGHDFGLKCYSCLDPVSYCNVSTTCELFFDCCAVIEAGPRIYHQCWSCSDCNFENFSIRLEEPKLEYRCCQKDGCNLHLNEAENNKEKGGTVTLSGKPMLLLMLVLVTSWNCFL